MSAAKTVLIVDDTRFARMMMRTMITNVHPNWTILEAENADDALAQSNTTPVDGMTIDLNMPGMDGLTLATTLRETHPTAYIALLTANLQDKVRQRAEEAGIGFLAKPITEDTMRTFLTHLEHGCD